MLKKVLYHLPVVTTVLGVFLIFGSVGSLELDRIGFLQFTVQAVLGLLMCGVSALYVEWEEDEYED